jgi:HK97 gp10 family phage protein
MKIEVTIEGEVFKGSQEKMARAINRSLRIAAIRVQADARLDAPRRYGGLGNSINYEVDMPNLRSTVGSNLEYAPYVEKGTGVHAVGGDGRKTPWTYYSNELKSFITTTGMKAQPYLVPALEKNKNHIVNIFKDEIRSALSG